MSDEEIRRVVRKGYARIVKQEASCCGPAGTCGDADLQQTLSRTIGYTDDELQSVPEGANLGLGCGNPVALTSLKEGDTVIDLGSGAGLSALT